jgi:hypothetical protein
MRDDHRQDRAGWRRSPSRNVDLSGTRRWRPRTVPRSDGRGRPTCVVMCCEMTNAVNPVTVNDVNGYTRPCRWQRWATRPCRLGDLGVLEASGCDRTRDRERPPLVVAAADDVDVVFVCSQRPTRVRFVSRTCPQNTGLTDARPMPGRRVSGLRSGYRSHRASRAPNRTEMARPTGFNWSARPAPAPCTTRCGTGG